MKKIAMFFSVLAFIAAVAALVIAAANFFGRRHALDEEDCEDFDDEMIDADLDFCPECTAEQKDPDLSVEAQGNTAPVDNAHEPADALPQEH